MKDPDIKRLFFGLELEGDWMPAPDGRVLDEKHRHCTLAFLGDQYLPNLLNALQNFRWQPCSEFQGRCDKLLFLPSKKPRVVAGHILWENDSCLSIHQQLITFLNKNHYVQIDKALLPHVTLARAPFTKNKWNALFVPFSIKATSLTLYQSLGNLIYQSVWKLSFVSS